MLNLNLPPVRTDDTPVMPLSVCRVNRSVHDSRYERRDTPWGEDYYWILGSGISFRSRTWKRRGSGSMLGGPACPRCGGILFVMQVWTG